ncbi:hypothetical protein EK0264_06900 [Epidermidibacterium keratini]|uniref:Uncharacterized protein n=1 Tax=Epidermidibacterium keratini TaxID=1891644 RepID=A0A7L4YMI3_9ACTN|nr:hypothetical protein [Epidermidibacterium keratini]QHC00029.1 hypothetical protein EK0264_06900 [Epidermidibacterium keratini]
MSQPPSEQPPPNWPSPGSDAGPGEYAGPPPTARPGPAMQANDGPRYDVVSPPYPQPGTPAPPSNGPRMHGAPPPWAAPSPPKKQRSVALMIAIAALTFVVLMGTVLVLVLNSNDAAPSSASPGGAAGSGSGDNELDAAWIEQELTTASEYVDGELVQTLTLSTDEDTIFSTCADDVTLQNYTISGADVSDDGTQETDMCLNGFEPTALDPQAIANAAADATGGAKLPVTVEIFGGNSYTPVLLVTVDGGYPTAYDQDGTELDMPINPLVAADRDAAFQAIVEKSGIDQLTAYCADIEYGAVLIDGSSPQDPDTIQQWSYSALPQQVGEYPEDDDLRFAPGEYDLQTYIDYAPQLDPKYTEDGASLAMVCVTTEWDDQAPVAGYYFSTGPEAADYDSIVYLSLTDFSLIYED